MILGGSLPLPDQVGAYGSPTEFSKRRLEAGQWVFWEDRVELILAGRYSDVKPLHVELSPTYLCNFSCPWCSCRAAREEWVPEDVFHHPRASDMTVMTEARLSAVVERLAEERIAIMWVGGEPTMNPLMFPAARRAADAGLAQCLFTNGSLLRPQRAAALLEAEFSFIRVSLNAVSDGVHQLHHAYRTDRPYAALVRQNLVDLARLRAASGALTEIGVSIVVDDVNYDDLMPSVRFLVEVCAEVGEGAIAFAIIRPAFPIHTAEVAGLDERSEELAELLAPGGEVETELAQGGIRLVAPQASLRTDHGSGEEAELKDYGEECLSCGWFGEITPSGEMILCSDQYGNPEYGIGNLSHRSVTEIWGGARRVQVLDDVKRNGCFKRSCPRNGRGYYLNRVFHSIERYRRCGDLARVRTWVEDLRKVIPPPPHSFFL